MSKKVVPLVFAGLLLAAALPARAYKPFESERNWLLGIQLGSFKPHVDDEPGLTGTPFADTFGNKPRLLTQISIERLLFKELGTFGLGLNGGFSEFFGNGFVAGSDVRSIDSVSLRLVPITAFAEYRFDYAARNWDVPFVPYAKAGIGTWIFWFNNALGETSDDGAAKGARWGWTWSAGLALQLDFFDRKLSNEFDREWGVNGTFIYADYTQQRVTSFGRAGLDFSANTWSGGLAFEF